MTLDRVAFESFFIATRSPLLAYLTRRVPTEDAADLLADLYLTAWRRRSDLPHGDEGRLWLYGVARRLVLNHHRMTTPNHLEPAAPDVASDVHDRWEDEAARSRERAVEIALATLNPLDRELVTLTTWERLSTAEAAGIVGITAGTARVRLHRARARLARHPRLTELIEGAEPPDHGAAQGPSLVSPTPASVLLADTANL